MGLCTALFLALFPLPATFFALCWCVNLLTSTSERIRVQSLIGKALVVTLMLFIAASVIFWEHICVMLIIREAVNF